MNEKTNALDYVLFVCWFILLRDCRSDFLCLQRTLDFLCLLEDVRLPVFTGVEYVILPVFTKDVILPVFTEDVRLHVFTDVRLPVFTGDIRLCVFTEGVRFPVFTEGK